MKISRITFLFLLLILLWIAGCETYKSSRKDARELADNSEWIVKETYNDPTPPNSDGSTTYSSSVCIRKRNGEDGIEFRVGKTDSKNASEEGFFILKSHPQYLEFARLRRGDKVRFEYSETSLQEDCPDGMFIKLKH